MTLTADRKRTTTPKPPADPVTAYARDVVKGKVVTGHLVRLAAERHLQDLRDAEANGWEWDVAAAVRAIDIFGNLRQSKGRWADQPLELLPWQAFCVGSVFGWKVKATGRRRFKIAYIEVARKNGKSTLSAGVGLILLDFDDEPGAEVYAAATKRDQAKIVWSEAESMVLKTAYLRKRIKIIPSRANMHVTDTSSKFEALGADSDSLDGLNVHGAIIDELHAHRDRKVVDVLETARGAREQPLFWYITTAGVDEESIYTETHDLAMNVVEGTFKDETMFVYIAALDPDDDWKDPKAYIKANPSLGVTVQLDELTAERDRAVQSPGKQNAFRRLRLNQVTQQVESDIDLDVWDKGKAPFDIASLKGRRCFGGMDLSSNVDLSAFALLFPPVETDENFKVLVWQFLPEENLASRMDRDKVPYNVWAEQGHIKLTSGNVIDHEFIRTLVNEKRGEFEIQELGFDDWQATFLVTKLLDDGAKMVKVPQTMAQLGPAYKEFEKLYMEGRLQHGGNPVLRWNAGNVAVWIDGNGNKKPHKAKSKKRIDGIAAILDAINRYLANIDDNPYKDRGLLILG